MSVAPTDPAVQARPDPSPGRAAAMIALAWLPAIVVAASLPRYARTFDRWPAHWELPPLTLALTSVGRLGVGPIVLVGVGLVALMAAAGAGWVRAGRRGGRALMVVLAAIGLGVSGVCMLGVLVPILTAPVGR